MSKVETVICDRCGKELTSYNLTQVSARIELWGIGERRSGASQRIDLCEDCYNAFITFMETIQ